MIVVIIIVTMVWSWNFQVFVVTHVSLCVIPTPRIHIVDCIVQFLIWLDWWYLPQDVCCFNDCWFLYVVDVMFAWYFQEVLLDNLFNNSCCSYYDWYHLYLLIPHSLGYYLEIYIIVQLLCGCHLDIVVIWYCHIYDHAYVWVFLLYDYVWFVAGDMSIHFYIGVPLDGSLIILHYSFLIVLVPVLHIYFEALVFACV